MRIKPFPLLLIFIMALAGCGQADTPAAAATSLPTSTTAATPTLQPSPTPTATATPSPTATATATATPSPTATATETTFPTATEMPATETSAVPPSATPTVESVTKQIVFNEEEVRQTVQLIAQTQGIPLGNDLAVTLLNKTLSIESTQLIFGQKFVTILDLAIDAVNGTPTVDVIRATLNGENLPPDAVLELERSIASGFANVPVEQPGTLYFESITIENGAMTVIYR